MLLNWNIPRSEIFEFTFEGRESSSVPDVLGEIVADVEA